jgi:hypothetical protein
VLTAQSRQSLARRVSLTVSRAPRGSASSRIVPDLDGRACPIGAVAPDPLCQLGTTAPRGRAVP